MEKICVIIPTIKTEAEIKDYVALVRVSDINIGSIIATCKMQSAAANRNMGLAASVDTGKVTEASDWVIMIDDDMDGFPDSWATRLIQELRSRPQVKILSARLMNKGGTYGTMRSFKSDIDNSQDVWVIPDSMVPSACIAFSRETWQAVANNTALPYNMPFDENYEKACAEDSDFCIAVIKTFPGAHVGVANRVRVIHLNEEKWRDEDLTWQKNHLYFQVLKPSIE